MIHEAKVNTETEAYRDTLIRDAILGMVRRYPEAGVFLLPTLDLIGLRFQKALMFSLWCKEGGSWRCFLSNVENTLVIGKGLDEFSPHRAPSLNPPTTSTPVATGGTVWLPCGTEDETVALTIQPRNAEASAAQEYAATLCGIFNDEAFWNELREPLRKSIHAAPDRWLDKLSEHVESHRAGLEAAARMESSRWDVFDPYIRQEADRVIGEFDAPDQFLAGIKRAIDTFLRAKRSFRPIHHPGPNENHSFPNLHFCVANAIPSSELRAECFPYTARLMFTSCQQEAFNEYLTEKTSRQLIDQVVTPLMSEPHSEIKEALRTILPLVDARDGEGLLRELTPPLQTESSATADTPFTSGSVAFGSSPGRSIDRARGESDLRRRIAESILYSVCRPQDGGQHIFHVPLHVNGVAWLNLFSFTEAAPFGNPESWRHNYLLYRDIITELGAQIRQVAELGYIDVIEELITRAWSSPIAASSTIIDSLNRQCYRLALAAPFPWIRFSNQASPSFERRLPHRRVKELYFSVVENPFFLQTVRFQELKPDHLVGRITKSAVRANDTLALEENRHVAYTAHMLKVPLRALHTAVSTVPNVHHRMRLCEVVEWMISLEDWLSPSFDASKTLSSRRDRKVLSFNDWAGEINPFLDYLRREFFPLFSLHTPVLETAFEIPDGGENPVYEFFSTQWKAAIQTMWNNACSFGRPGAPVRMTPFEISHQNRSALAIRMSNEVEITEDELDERIARTRAANINQLGIATLNLLARRLLSDPDYDVVHQKEVDPNGALSWVVTMPIALKLASNK